MDSTKMRSRKMDSRKLAMPDGRVSANPTWTEKESDAAALLSAGVDGGMWHCSNPDTGEVLIYQDAARASVVDTAGQTVYWLDDRRTAGTTHDYSQSGSLARPTATNRGGNIWGIVATTTDYMEVTGIAAGDQLAQPMVVAFSGYNITNATGANAEGIVQLRTGTGVITAGKNNTANNGVPYINAGSVVQDTAKGMTAGQRQYIYAVIDNASTTIDINGEKTVTGTAGTATGHSVWVLLNNLADAANFYCDSFELERVYKIEAGSADKTVIVDYLTYGW